MLITGLEWCGLLVDYCDVFISCLYSHSDGTHSLQRIHWWASDAMLHFSKSDEETNSSTSWMARGWRPFQQILICGWTTPLMSMTPPAVACNMWKLLYRRGKIISEYWQMSVCSSHSYNLNPLLKTFVLQSCVCVCVCVCSRESCCCCCEMCAALWWQTYCNESRETERQCLTETNDGIDTGKRERIELLIRVGQNSNLRTGSFQFISLK